MAATSSAMASRSGRADSSRSWTQATIAASSGSVITTCRACSAAGPSNWLAGTIWPVSRLTGPGQNGRKPPGQKRTPSVTPSPSSLRRYSRVTTP